MENESALKVLEHKLNDYAYGYEDFKVPFELMVNITLSEYRALVKSDAVARAEIEKLKAEIEELKNDVDKFKGTADRLNKENVLCTGQLQATVNDNFNIIKTYKEAFKDVYEKLLEESDESYIESPEEAFVKAANIVHIKMEEVFKDEQFDNA